MLKIILASLYLVLYSYNVYAEDLLKILSKAFENNSKLNAKRATTVSIESGIQNASVGITVGGLILASPDGGLSTLSLPSGVYGVLMYIVVAPFVYWSITQSED